MFKSINDMQVGDTFENPGITMNTPITIAHKWSPRDDIVVVIDQRGGEHWYSKFAHYYMPENQQQTVNWWAD